MNKNDDTTQAPQPLTLEPLSYLAKHSVAGDPNEPQKMETYANNITTNIITDASRVASGKHHENIDNTGMDNSDGLNSSLSPTSNQIHQPEHSISNGIHSDNEFDNEDIQKKMNTVIHDIRSGPGDDTNTSRKSITSNHLQDGQINTSTPITNNPSTEMDLTSKTSTENPINESASVDHHISTEQHLPSPVQQVEISSDDDDHHRKQATSINTTSLINSTTDQHLSEQENHIKNPSDDDFFDTKAGTIDDDKRPSSAVKQSIFDETTHFATTSTKPSSSRVQSATSKRSVQVTPDEPSTSGDEKHIQMTPSKLSPDTGNDTDLDNQEVATVARRPSRAMSPVHRPRSPTPNDSRKASITIEPSSSLHTKQLQSPTHVTIGDHTTSSTLNNNKSISPIVSNDNQEDEEEQKQNFEPLTTIISPTSRRESTNKNDQQQTSRPTSATKTKFDDSSFEPSTSRPTSSSLHHSTTVDDHLQLVKPGEQLQIPTDDFDNERINSPPPSPSGIKSTALTDSSLENNVTQKEQDHSRRPSEINRKSPTKSMISNGKDIDGEVLSSNSPRENDADQQQTDITHQKSASRRESQVIGQTEHISSSRRASTSQQQDQFDSHRQQLTESRRTSHVAQEPTNHEESFVPEDQTIHRRESTDFQQKPSSRKGSIASEKQIPSKRTSITAEHQTSSRRESTTNELPLFSERESTAVEEKLSSRKGSTATEHEAPSKRGSIAHEQHTSSRRGSTIDETHVLSKRGSITVEQKPSSRKGSTTSEHAPPSKRDSTTVEQKPSSRKGSTTSEHAPPSKRESITSEQQTSSRRGSIKDEPQVSSRRGSIKDEPQVSSKRGSTAHEQQTSSRRESTADEPHVSSKRSSTAPEQKPSSRKESTASEQEAPSKRGSLVHILQTSSRRESTSDEPHTTSKRGSTVHEEQVFSRRESSTHEAQLSSKRGSIAYEQKPSSRKGSTVSEHEPSSKRESFTPEQHISSRRESSSDQHKIASRKGSTAFQQQSPSKRESSSPEQQSFIHRKSHQEISSSRRTSTHRDNESSSPHRSGVVNNISPSQESSRRNSFIKQEHQPIPVYINKDNHPSGLNIIDTNHQQINHESNSLHRDVLSSNTGVPVRTSAKYEQERTPSIEKRQKSSSTVDENDKHQLSFNRRSGQQSKRNSNVISDETVVTPIIMDSSKARQQSGNHTLRMDSDNEYTSKSKLPPVSSSLQNKTHHSEIINKQKIPRSNRSEMQQLASSRTSTQSDEERQTHWTKQILVPSIPLTDDDAGSPREEQPRPQSPNVEQIAERNQPPTPPITITSVKKRNIADGKKLKEQQFISRRSASVDSVNPIRMVDDNSLDSTSENNSDFESKRRRHVKPKKKDVETNTDETYDIQQQNQQRNFFDNRESTPQKPLKATKPMVDHFHSTRRRAPNSEQILATPDTISNADTPTIRRTVKLSNDHNQDKEPVNVNVTVVVKRFAGTNDDGTSRTITEAFIDQKPQQYFEHVQHPPAILPPSSPTGDKEKPEESIERPRTSEQSPIKSSEQIIEHHDRETHSDTEHIITDKQKKNRRPKRISRTCQTYECVFRRMEREQYHDLRATSDTEKNIQTLKSQLRPRRKSSKKNLPLYLSADSFRVEELLPKSFHQSRRNMSKSSALARSLSPQGGKLLILRPTLPFHHTDAVNVQRVCLQYAIDLIPNDNMPHGTMSTHRNKSNVFKHPEQTTSLPMISTSSSGFNIPTNKSNSKEKSASNKSEEYMQQRKTGGGV
ncbi:unnamed protein product [Rotaria sp. Silwood1]|nr:unnamed protein product [Rotaria sp. Silwood1]CAF4570120.1 unnamed protein product [Rotaria sp. Silwood1]